MRTPLQKLRVLDLTRDLAGPFCSMLLGDLGAEIIKVEMPGKGDETREWGPPFIEGESVYFLSANRNKKSMTVNLKTAEGRQIILDLARISDVFMENFRPGVAKKLGVDYQAIKKENPKIVYCSISGFGQTGPYRDRIAYDIVFQAIGGLMGITGEEGRPPVKIGVAVADIVAGLYATISILTGLRDRDDRKVGQYIDISITDCTASLLTYMAGYYFATGRAPKKMGSAHPFVAPYQAFRAKDGRYLIIGVANDRIWERLCKVLGRTDLASDPRFETNSRRVQNRDLLIPIIEETLASQSRDEWLTELSKASVPCGPVYSVDEVFSDSQIRSREMLVEIEHPRLGKIKLVGNPLKFSDMPAQLRLPPPILGQHTQEILESLAEYSKDTIEEYRRKGVI